MNEIALVSVTYNSESAVPFFAKTACGFDDVFVVDNASTDNTLVYLAKAIPFAKLFVHASNEGFGVANNTGFEAAKKMGFSWVLFVNPDCRITYEDACRLRDAISERSNAVIAFPQIADENGNERKVYTWDFTKPYKYKAPLEVEGRSSASQELIPEACIDGSCFMVNVALFEKMGAFTRDLFLFCEEDDINLRAARSGYEVLFVPTAFATHLGGKSSASNWKIDLLKSYSVRWSRFFMTNKYIGATSRLIEVVGVLLFSPFPIVLNLVVFNKRRFARWLGWLMAALDGLLMTKFFRKIF